jgi:hypothetical protein
MTLTDRTNGFRVRGINGDSGRCAVQSTHQTTFMLTRRRWGGIGPNLWHEVGLAQSELIVIRGYGGEPEVELEGLGGPHGVLIVENTRGETVTLRNGSRRVFSLGRDGALVIKTEHWIEPRHSIYAQDRV